MNKQIGLTKNTGYQVGARRTFNIALEDAWNFILSEAGCSIWLGDVELKDLAPGDTYKLDNNISGEIRVLKPLSHLRMTWQPADWKKASTIQLRVIANAKRTTIAFHQENLPDSSAREQRLLFYKDVLDKFGQHIEA